MENKELAVYKLNFDCGRMGNLEGLFVAHKNHVKKLIEDKLDVYFGEVLGKHSEVYGPIEECDIELVSDSPEVVKVVIDHKLENGHNPFDYTALNTEEQFQDWTIRDIINAKLTNSNHGE